MRDERGAGWTTPAPTRWLLLLALLGLGWVALQPRGIAVEVVGKRWQRQIDIERQVLEMASEPCAQMPAGASLKERRVVEGTEHCRFLAPAWRKVRAAVAQGDDAVPAWPPLTLQPGEREGRRHAWQALELRDDGERRWHCRLALPAWQGWHIGQRTRLAVHRFSGVADCSTLPPPPASA